MGTHEGKKTYDRELGMVSNHPHLPPTLYTHAQKDYLTRLRASPRRLSISTMAPNAHVSAAVQPSRLLVDFSAFVAERSTGEKLPPDHIIKEISIVDIDSGCHQNLVFKPPKDTYHWDGSEPLERHNQWLIDRYHGLDYDVGFLNYEALTDAINLLCSGATLLYTSNRVKAKILEDLLYKKREVVDVASLGCPPSPYAQICSEYDGVSYATYYDIDGDSPREQEDSSAAEGEEIWTSHSCMNHRSRGGRFVCTLSTARHMARWVAQNLSFPAVECTSRLREPSTAPTVRTELLSQ